MRRRKRTGLPNTVGERIEGRNLLKFESMSLTCQKWKKIEKASLILTDERTDGTMVVRITLKDFEPTGICLFVLYSVRYSNGQYCAVLLVV